MLLLHAHDYATLKTRVVLDLSRTAGAICVCIYTAVYSQTLTAISIFKYVNKVCIIQVHILALFGLHVVLR